MDDFDDVRLPNGADPGPRSVVDQVASRVLNMILASELVPGQPVSIRDLSVNLAVSNVPVREALRRLEGRGLVEFRRGRKPQIAPIDATDFNDIYRLRALLEGQIAAHTADHITPARLVALEETLDEFERILNRGSAFDVYSVHSKFHLLLLPGATAWDRRLLDQLWAASERYIQLYLGAKPTPDVARAIVVAHRALVDAARGGDSLAIQQAVVDHVEHSRLRMADTVEAIAEHRAPH